MAVSEGSVEATWPNVWSGWQILAWSGARATTNWHAMTVGRLLADGLGVAIDGLRLRLTLELGEPGELTAESLCCCHIGGDRARLVVALSGGRTVDVVLGYTDHELFRVVVRHRDGGALPVRLGVSSDDPSTWVRAASLQNSIGSFGFALAPAAEAEMSREAGVPPGVTFRWDVDEGVVQFALSLAAAGPIQTPALLDGAELAEFEAGPQPPAPAKGISPTPLLERVRQKAVAILESCVYSPQGDLPRRWIVPQRLRHRNFNLHQTPLLALGALTFDADLATDLLLCAASQIEPNGQLPEQAWPTGKALVNPAPLLCWACWRTAQLTGRHDLLEEALPALKSHVRFQLATRLLERLGYSSSRGGRFLTWGGGDGSGMSNSPRFDINEPFAAVDLTCYAIHEVDMLARIIEELTPEHREALYLGWVGEGLAREAREYFWNAEQGWFVDRYPDDDPVGAHTISGAVALFAGLASDEQAGIMAERHLCNPGSFHTAFPLASLSVDDPRFDLNMWRGGAWPAMNVLTVIGLRRYGLDTLADELHAKTIEELARWYEATGTLWEFYDSTGQRPPHDLPRGRRTGALPEHAWTAAAFLVLLHDLDRP